MFEYEGTVYICADKIKEFKNLILSNCPYVLYQLLMKVNMHSKV